VHASSSYISKIENTLYESGKVLAYLSEIFCKDYLANLSQICHDRKERFIDQRK